MTEREQSVWTEDAGNRGQNSWTVPENGAPGNRAMSASGSEVPGNRAMSASGSEVSGNRAMGASGSEVPGNTAQDVRRREAPVQGRASGETEETKRMRANYGFIAPTALGYGIFYAFCMYRNASGVTFPLFVGGSILFFCLIMVRLGIPRETKGSGAGSGSGGSGNEYGAVGFTAERDGTAAGTAMGVSGSQKGLGLKKGSWFYIAAMMLLGISTFCTDDNTIIFFNKLGAFLLLMSLLLKQFFNTSGWKLGKYLGSICIMIGASFGELGRPFTDKAVYNKSREKKTDRRIWYFLLGLLIGVPLLLVVLLLLASADAVFQQMTAKLLKSISLAGIFNVMVRIAVLFFGAYALTAYLCKRQIKEEVTDKRRGEPVLAITITGLLTLLYLFFSIIQIVGLFLGKLQLPEGYTYAMYARQGFFQLLTVSLLNLLMVLGCMSFFKESKVLKGILTVMSLCTFIMIASSFMRMIIYIRYYYLTYLRILVLWALVLLAALFVGVVLNIFRESFPLFHYSVAVVAVLYLGLSFAHPDYIIAKVNIANAPHGDMLMHLDGTEWTDAELSGINGDFFLVKEPYQDYAYLRTLSADAAPVLVPYLRELGYSLEAFYTEDAVEYAEDEKLWGSSYGARSGQGGFGYYWMRKMQRRTENFGIRTFNISRYRALTEFRREAGGY